VQPPNPGRAKSSRHLGSVRLWAQAEQNDEFFWSLVLVALVALSRFFNDFVCFLCLLGLIKK
jgi:hypothetical protein